MKCTKVSVAEGKKKFSLLIKNSMEKNEEFVVTKRGKPVAVLLSYEEYMRTKKIEAFKKILEAGDTFAKAGIALKDIIKESRKELEKK
jgi:prevent-host-death family protein